MDQLGGDEKGDHSSKEGGGKTTRKCGKKKEGREAVALSTGDKKSKGRESEPYNSK